MTAITLTPPAADLTRAGRVDFYHRLSGEAGRISIMAAVAAGIELHRAKAELEHGGFTAWIKRSCTFSQRTANNYMALAESVAHSQLPAMIEAPEAPTIDAIEEISEPIEARSLTQLYFDLGICRPGKVGGARPGAGRPPKQEPDANAELHEALLLANRFAADLRTWAIADDGLGHLPDDVLKQWLADIGDVMRRGRQILTGRKTASKARNKTT